MPVARLAALAAALALCLSGEWYAGGRGPAGSSWPGVISRRRGRDQWAND